MKLNKALDRMTLSRKRDVEMDYKMGMSLSTAMIGSKVSKLQETEAMYSQKMKNEADRLR